jgi:hypothetical protein
VLSVLSRWSILAWRSAGKTGRPPGRLSRRRPR